MGDEGFFVGTSVDLDFTVPVPEERRGEVAAYLASHRPTLAARHLEDDELDPSRTRCVPVGFASDEVYTWPLAAVYYVKYHGTGVPVGLLRHVLSRLDDPDGTASEAEDL